MRRNLEKVETFIENSLAFNLAPVMVGDKMTGIIGKTSSLGDFRMDFVANNKSQVKRTSYSSIDSPGPHKFTESVQNSIWKSLRQFEEGNYNIGPNSDPNATKSPNLIVYQVTAEIPFDIDISFMTSASDMKSAPIIGDLYTRALLAKQNSFDMKFEDTFRLEDKYQNQSHKIKFAQAALSNMIGGIGYFYGHSMVQSKLQTVPVKYWDGPLFTAVPSRSFFPRGFLWDEGFHNLLISKWNKKLSADIIAHWLDMMNVEGK